MSNEEIFLRYYEEIIIWNDIYYGYDAGICHVALSEPGV